MQRGPPLPSAPVVHRLLASAQGGGKRYQSRVLVYVEGHMFEYAMGGADFGALSAFSFCVTPYSIDGVCEFG